MAIMEPTTVRVDGENGGRTQLIAFNVLQPPGAQPHQKVTLQLINIKVLYFRITCQNIANIFSDICLFSPQHIHMILIREFCEYL